MATKTYEKIKKEIKQELIEEFVLPLLRDVRDNEGEYTYNPKTFLRQIGC